MWLQNGCAGFLWEASVERYEPRATARPNAIHASASVTDTRALNNDGFKGVPLFGEPIVPSWPRRRNAERSPIGSSSPTAIEDRHPL